MALYLPENMGLRHEAGSLSRARGGQGASSALDDAAIPGNRELVHNPRRPVCAMLRADGESRWNRPWLVGLSRAHLSDDKLEWQRTMNRSISRTIAFLGVFASMSATAITVDGNLADWGVNPHTWAPSAGVGSIIHSTIDDQIGSGNYRLGPGWGGQAYDAEALYATIAGNRLYIALATGHNPRTPNQPAANSYGVGDFAIDFGKDGSFEVGINIKHVVSANGGGYTYESFGVEGGVYQTVSPGNWAYGLWDVNGTYTNPSSSSYKPDPRHPTYLTGGTLLGLAQLAYTTNPVKGYGDSPNDDHYFYEIGVDLAYLTAAGWNRRDAFNIHWTENCANDSIVVDPPSLVSEPGTLALLGLSLLTLVRRGRKKGGAS